MSKQPADRETEGRALTLLGVMIACGAALVFAIFGWILGRAGWP